MVALLFFVQIQSQHAVFKGSLDPDPAVLGRAYYNCSFVGQYLQRCNYLRNQKCLALSDPNCRRSQNLKIRPLDLTTPVCGYFVMYEIGLAKIYLCTKLDVSSFTHSRYMEQGLKFKILDPDHAPFGGILSQIR